MIDALNCVVTLDRDPSGDIGTTGTNPAWHPLLRRWDGAGAAVVTEGSWLDLEDGVQVLFPGTQDAALPARYRPATTADPGPDRPRRRHLAAGRCRPQALPPAGIAYHYAPLAFVPADRTAQPVSLRQMFSPLAP